MHPKLTVSGYRGIWGDTLTEDIALEYVRAFALLVLARGHATGKKTLLVGRDGRESGPLLAKAVITELVAAGFSVTDLGMMPTPTVLFLVRSEQADGAIIITASHNPIEYNGLKFATETGGFLNGSEVSEIENLRGAPLRGRAGGASAQGSGYFKKHLDAILQATDISAIRAREFDVALDPINSVGCTTTPQLLDALGAAHAGINTEATGQFAHAPEPVPKNLAGLQALVQETKADVGFAQDPDGDRLVVCDETGTLPSEEVMLALSVLSIMHKTPGDIVINLSTSNMSEDIAASFGHKTFRSKVGEANVLAGMREHAAVAGGEGSGGIIYPKMNAARDSFAGIALILELMAREKLPLSRIIASLPRYFMTKKNISFDGDLAALFASLTRSFSDAKTTTLDGLRLDFPNRSWIHVRPSNTEPIIRIIIEAGAQMEALGLMSMMEMLLH